MYTVGHLRSRGRKQIFPLEGADGEDSVEVVQIGQRNRLGRDNLNQYRTYSPDGVAPCLNKMDGGGLEPHIPVQFGIDKNTQGAEIECANALTAREDRGVSNYKQTGTAVAITMGYDRGLNEITTGAFPTCNARDYKGINFRDLGGVAIPVLTPDRAEKRQNGRRFKDNGDEAFTLTAQDRHGVALKVNDKEVYAVWYEKYNCYIAIRKLTPRECFRLQGWKDDYFEKAAFVNSDSQLYKQAGNAITVDIAEEIGRAFNEIEIQKSDD